MGKYKKNLFTFFSILKCQHYSNGGEKRRGSEIGLINANTNRAVDYLTLPQVLCRKDWFGRTRKIYLVVNLATSGSFSRLIIASMLLMSDSQSRLSESEE